MKVLLTYFALSMFRRRCKENIFVGENILNCQSVQNLLPMTEVHCRRRVGRGRRPGAHRWNAFFWRERLSHPIVCGTPSQNSEFLCAQFKWYNSQVRKIVCFLFPIFAVKKSAMKWFFAEMGKGEGDFAALLPSLNEKARAAAHSWEARLHGTEEEPETPRRIGRTRTGSVHWPAAFDCLRFCF